MALKRPVRLSAAKAAMPISRKRVVAPAEPPPPRSIGIKYRVPIEGESRDETQPELARKKVRTSKNAHKRLSRSNSGCCFAQRALRSWNCQCHGWEPRFLSARAGLGHDWGREMGKTSVTPQSHTTLCFPVETGFGKLSRVAPTNTKNRETRKPRNC